MEEQLDRLRTQIGRGRQLEDLHLHEGWNLVVEELHKILEATRRQAVSKDLLGKSVEHAALVGAHNALESFLHLITDAKDRTPKLAEQLDRMEQDNKEEIDRLGIQTRF